MEVILHGGASSRDSAKNRDFFKHIFSKVDKVNLRVLCVYFARPERRWEDSFREDFEKINAANPELSLQIKIAKRETFAEYISNCDVIFINGGRSGFLKEELIKLGDLRECFDNKIVVGISAGANLLSRYYYSSIAKDVREGVGLLDIKLLTHYKEGSDSEIKSLEGYGEKLEVYKIREEEYLDFMVG